MSKKDIHIVTGGAGFVGSHLIDKLMLDRNNKVICLDNFKTGKLENIKKWESNCNFNLVNHDITNPINLKADFIWHLACPASPIKYQADPLYISKLCSIGTLNILELARANKAKIFFASSSEIYGHCNKQPLKEDFRSVISQYSQRSCYANGKIFSEGLFLNYRDKYKLQIRIARIFNTYGLRMLQDDYRVISNFIYKAIKGEDLVIYGDGNQTRSFCYIDDLIKGLFMIFDGDYQNPINIGSNEEISIKDLALKVIDVFNSESEIAFKFPREDEPYKRKPCLNLINNLYNWDSKINLAEGLNNFKNKLVC